MTTFNQGAFQNNAFQSAAVEPAFDVAFQINAFQAAAGAQGVTADSSLTADSGCWTADGRIICIAADVAEAANGLDALDATAVAGGAVISADVAEAATASDLADATINAQVLFGTVDESIGSVAFDDNTFQSDAFQAVGAALDQLDATVEAATVPIDGGGAYYPPLQRPFPVVGVGYGILRELEGEAHGVVGAVAKGAAQLLVRANAIGVSGQAGEAAAILKALSVTGKGAIGARGAGEGVIMKVSGSATGHHDDDEAAVIAFLLAA